MTEQERREKVIKGLECCGAYDYKCNVCPYQDDGGAEDGCCSDELKTNALALLKAQEPMLVVSKDTNEIIGDCPRCGRYVIHWHNKYCSECGQAVKWE